MQQHAVLTAPVPLLDEQVSARGLSSAALGAAKNAVGDRAQPALELVGYEPELDAAMQYAFGGCFVCQVSAGPSSALLRWLVSGRCWIVGAGYG